ncbi:MAG: sugar transferase, partial [Acetatifactor sp.]|nr:sugar transferase [Acetatifactor sp.]
MNTNENRLRRIESFKRVINLGLSAICLAMEIGIFTYYWLTVFNPTMINAPRKIYFKGNMLEVAIYGVILFFLSNMYGGMRLGYLKNWELIFSQIFATIMADGVIYAELSMMSFMLLAPQVFIIMFLEQLVVVVIYINIANRIYRSAFPPRKLLLVHGNRPIDDICNKFASRKDKYKIVQTVNIRKGIRAVRKQIEAAYANGECNAVVLGDISVEQRNKLFKYCYEKSIRVYVLPKIPDVIMMGAEELHVFDTPLLLTREYHLRMEQRFLKRFGDIVFALLLLIIASPIMLLTAIAIKLYDGGPVLYKQVRCTIGQKEFKIMKFRSMRTDAEKDGVARLASKNDSRITPVGNFIRKCRIDELPQLFNILKGD